MDLTIFAIYDQKADAYLNPFFLPNEALAQRTFGDCVNDPDHAFGKNPQDYTLFNLGVFNTQSGTIEVHGYAKSLGSGVEYKHASSEASE